MSISTDGVTKYYGRLAANRDVSVTIETGRVHALVGENGAGKSTLAKILAGAVRPTLGAIRIGEREVQFDSPRDALALGIGMVPQHPALIPEMTVVDNCLFGHRSSDKWLLSRAATRAQLEEIAAPLGFEIPLDIPVARLSLGERQRAEILRLLRRKARTLILDEPTDVLSPKETDLLFEALRVIVGDGATVVVITHRLAEVFAIANDVTVLRDGTVAGSEQISALSEARLIGWMLGRAYSAPASRVATASGSVRLKVARLRSGGRVPVADASFEVVAGEIVGLAGDDGNGQEELAGAIAGTVATRGGHVELEGRALEALTAAERNTAGPWYVPADRQREGLVLGMSVAENLALRKFQANAPSDGGPIVRMPALRATAVDLVERYGIKCPSVDARVTSLSGGNQQKVILARELARQPKALIAAQPTRGLDVAARDAVHGELLALARDGSAVLLISSDLDEVLRLSDRVLVLQRGGIAAEFRGPGYDIEAVGRAMAASGPPSEETTGDDSTDEIATAL